jgi:hypothetical protein
MVRTALRALAVAAFGVALCRTGAAFAEVRPWDQAEATRYAERFSDLATSFHDQIRKLRADSSLVPITKDEMDLVELNARHLDERARGFAAKLAEGKDREETEAPWENIETTLRNVAEHGRSEWVTQEIYRSWGELRRVHLEIADYYGDHDVDPRLEDIRVEPPR